MDKYEYNIKADQIMKLIDRRDFKTAAKIADGIDWRRVRNINMLTNVGCVYQAVGRYTDAKEIFQLARNRAPLGRRLVYQMADVCIDAGEFEEAEHYIQEFSELAPKDTARFELLYQLSKRKGEPIENQIAILEEYKKQDFDERWSFELAKLYHKAGYSQKCVAACDELVLWFGEGQYVDKAMELKMLHAPLSPSQQEKYANMKKKKEASVVKEESHPVSNAKGKSYEGMYNTENLQAALTKSIQEIMEAEEQKKASYPSGRSYFEEYQSEQEEREAMFAATRDLRREREKFKNMMTQPIPSLMTEGNFSGNTLRPTPIQPYTNYSEDFEQTEEETKRVFETAKETFGDTKELAPTFDILEEAENAYEMTEPVEESVSEPPIFSTFDRKTEGNLNNVWEDMGNIFGSLRKEPISQNQEDSIQKEGQLPLAETSSNNWQKETEKERKKGFNEENQSKSRPKEKERFQDRNKLEEKDTFEEEGELEEVEDGKNKDKLEEMEAFEDRDVLEDIEASQEFQDGSEPEDLEEEEFTNFSEEDFLGEDFYYQVPEEKEPEYIEVPFLLHQLNTNEIPIEIYYRISDYDPQPFLDKAARNQTETISSTEENTWKGDTREIEETELGDAPEKTELEDDTKELEEAKQGYVAKELDRNRKESEQTQNKDGEEQEINIEKAEEDRIENRSENYEKASEMKKSEELEEVEYEEFPEGGTEEEFYQYIMMRSYGVDEMSEDAYYQVAGYQERKPKEKEPPVPLEAEKIDDYVYGVERMPEDAYYEVPGYDPEGFLAGRMESQGLEEEILGQKPQIRIQSKPVNGAIPKQKIENQSYNKSEKKVSIKLEEKSEGKTDIKLMSEQQAKNEEPPLELTPEFKNVFASYLHLPGVEQQIAEILEKTERIGEEKETSMFGNILLMGEVKSGKTTLAVALIKAMNRLNGRKGRKVAKISGDRLNNKGIKESISRLAGADLIIEHAGEMRISTVTELLKAMGDYTGGMIVVLEDTRTSIERLLADVPQLAVCFTHQIELKECNIAEWAEAAKSYAQENHYIVDDMAMLALSAKIDAVYANKKNIMMEDVQDIIDDAIEKAERRNKKLFGRLFSKKKDSDSILLRESDFS